MAEHDQPSGEEQRGRGIVSRLTEGIGRAGQVAHRASDVFTGADIRAFDEFTDAVTRVTVGLHRDQAELREHMERLNQSVAEIRDTQALIVDRLTAVERELAARKEQNQGSVISRLWRMLILRR